MSYHSNSQFPPLPKSPSFKIKKKQFSKDLIGNTKVNIVDIYNINSVLLRVLFTENMQIANTCLIGPKHLYAPLHGSEKLMEKLFSNKKIHKYIISSFQKRKKK